MCFHACRLKRHSERRSKKQRLDAAKAGFSTGGDMPYDQQLGGEAFSSAPFDREGMGSASGDGAGMHAVSHLQLLQAVQASGGVGVSMDGANGTGDMHGGKGEHMDPDDDATHGSDLGTSEGEADLDAADSGGADGAASGVDGDDKDAAD